MKYILDKIELVDPTRTVWFFVISAYFLGCFLDEKQTDSSLPTRPRYGPFSSLLEWSRFFVLTNLQFYLPIIICIFFLLFQGPVNWSTNEALYYLKKKIDHNPKKN